MVSEHTPEQPHDRQNPRRLPAVPDQEQDTSAGDFIDLEGRLQQQVQHGFIIEKEEVVPEVGGIVRVLKHVKTEATLVSIENQDENKLFWAGFKTPAAESTGVAHIMEHSVLCGSDKYPLKDPFVQLLRGSMNTFINAFTAADRTMYPIASTNDRDFMNQAGVYLDAVLHPLLKKEAFLQEGWRYDFDEESGRLIRSGIVYNEMKGAYSDPMGLLYRDIKQSLFPDTDLAYDSGGDPRVIPELTYERYLDFHKEKYHPSNSCIIVYGNHNSDEMLQFLDSELSEFNRGNKSENIGIQPNFTEPKTVEGRYPAEQVEEGDAQNAKAFSSVNWKLGEIADPIDQFSLFALDYVLLMSPSAPLRRAGIESGLGEGIATWGLDLSQREGTFSFGLKGVDPENCKAVEEMVLGTLERLARDGIDRADVEAGLNRFEFSIRENDTGGTPQAFTAAREIMVAWMYDRDIVDSVKYEDTISEFRSRLDSNPRYLEELIEEHFLRNTHRTTVNLLPDEGLAQRLAEEERAELAQIEENLTDEQRQQIADDLEALKHYQNTPDSEEAIATIPRLSVSDLSRDIEHIETNETEISGAVALHHNVDTKGLSYCSAVFDLSGLPAGLRSYGPVFSRLLFEAGTETDDYVSFQQRIGAASGGIGAGVSVYNPLGSTDPRLELRIGGKSTDAMSAQMLSLMGEGAQGAKLSDQERTLQIVRESKSRLEQGVIGSGHGVVSRRLGARLSESGRIGEELYGIGQLEFLRDLEQRIEDDWPSVQTDLEAFRQGALGKNNVLLSYTGSAEQYVRLQSTMGEFIDALPEVEKVEVDHSQAGAIAVEALVVPSEVNYVGKGVQLPVEGDRLTNAYSVTEKHLNRKFLWEEIRVKGGAYGSFAGVNTLTGAFTAVSYRDKNLFETLDVYDQIAEHLETVELTDEELGGLIISAISEIDSHKLPPAKGAAALSRYLMNLDDDTRQDMRNEVLNASIADFRSLGELLRRYKKEGMVAVLGPATSAQELQNRYGDEVEVKQVL
jgi:hypothetical protein